MNHNTPVLPGDESSAAFTVTATGEFASLRTGWDELVRAMQRPSPFLLHGWLSAWIRHYVKEGELRVHVVRRDGKLVGALPLSLIHI